MEDIGGMNDTRQLKDLVSVGPKTVEDFHMLGITTVAQLKSQTADRLYERLCRKMKTRIDPCQHDVFCAAIEQAKNPRLPLAKCQWWYWSKIRKAARD
jgi:nucleotidyltransferase/DNA polymerase involved in DNA repair